MLDKYEQKETFQSYGSSSPLELAATEQALLSLKDLLEEIANCVSDAADSRPIQLVVYFDEAHVLAEKKSPPNQYYKTLYDIFCSCLNNFVGQPVFFIFLSTSFCLANPVAVQPYGRSHGIAMPQAPITETPFDCAGGDPIERHTLGLADISTVEFMARFGRPL